MKARRQGLEQAGRRTSKDWGMIDDDVLDPSSAARRDNEDVEESNRRGCGML